MRHSGSFEGLYRRAKTFGGLPATYRSDTRNDGYDENAGFFDCPTPDVGLGIGSHECPKTGVLGTGLAPALFTSIVDGTYPTDHDPAETLRFYAGATPSVQLVRRAPDFVQVFVLAGFKLEEGVASCPAEPSFDCGPLVGCGGVITVDTTVGYFPYDETQAADANFPGTGTTYMPAAGLSVPGNCVTIGFGTSNYTYTDQGLPGGGDETTYAGQFAPPFLKRAPDELSYVPPTGFENDAVDTLIPWAEFLTMELDVEMTADAHRMSASGLFDGSDGLLTIAAFITPWWLPDPSGWMCVL